VRRVGRFAALVVWMGLIFWLSTDRGSSEHTRSALQVLLGDLFPGLSDAWLGRIDWNVRKTAHITEYAILGILAYRALHPRVRELRHSAVVGSLVVGLAYAISDEWHQSFVPSRGAAASDVFFDFFGILVGVALCLWHHAGVLSKLTRAKQGSL
jgi:VanZ family protein